MSRKRIALIAAVVVLAAGAGAGIASSVISSRIQEFHREAEESPLFEGLNSYGFTRSLSSETHTYTFLARESEPLTLAVWSKGLTGSFSLALHGPDGALRLQRDGLAAEWKEAIPLQTGFYRLELTFRAYSGSIRIGYGGIQMVADLPADGFQLVSADPASGFSWDYLLYIPRTASVPYLLVLPNNTGFEESEYAFHRESAKQYIQWMREFADELGTPLMVPVFPRPGGELSQYYTHNLDRNALLMEQDGYRRLDRQLLKMIEHARPRLAAAGHPVVERVWMLGFSAAGTFSDRFSLLHPEAVAAVVAGGCTHSLPLPDYAGENLPYPIGTYDYAEIEGHPFDGGAFAALPRFLFKGDRDSGGWQITESGRIPADEYFERFTRAELEAQSSALPVPPATGLDFTLREEEIIKYRIYRKAVFVGEFRAVRDIFAESGLDQSTFRLYPDAGHEFTDAMWRDVLEFFRNQLATA